MGPAVDGLAELPIVRALKPGRAGVDSLGLQPPKGQRRATSALAEFSFSANHGQAVDLHLLGYAPPSGATLFGNRFLQIRLGSSPCKGAGHSLSAT